MPLERKAERGVKLREEWINRGVGRVLGLCRVATKWRLGQKLQQLW